MLQQITEGLSKALEGAGLNEGEIKTFLFLIAHDVGMRASEIARRVKMNRTTLYGIVNSLLDKGLVSSAEKSGVLFFQAIQPHLLIDYLERTNDQQGKNIKKVNELVPAILRERNQEERYRPNIRFFDGTEGIKQVYEDLIRNNKEKLVYGFTGIHAVYNLMSMDWIDYVLEKRPALGVKWLALAVDSPESRELSKHDKEQLRATKFLPPSYNFEIELASYDNKTAVMTFAEDHPWGMIIEDKKIADTVKALFCYVDSMLPGPPMAPLGVKNGDIV